MPAKLNSYFIAIVPPQQICDEVNAFREDFADRFNSSAALRVVPHLTLKAPFNLPAEEHEHTMQWFNQMQVTVTGFEQELKNFGAFHNKKSPVVFVNPIMNAGLYNLQKEVLHNFSSTYTTYEISNQELEFNPHITIAYRDLKPPLFKQAWQQYQEREYSATFTVNSFHLFQHDTKKWNIVATFYL